MESFLDSTMPPTEAVESSMLGSSGSFYGLPLLVWNKLACAAVILGIDCIGAFAPFLSRKSTSENTTALLSLGNTFGGGAMLALCLFHLLPEAYEGYRSSIAIPLDTDKPEFFCKTFWYVVAASFVLVLVIEKVPFVFLGGRSLPPGIDHHHHGGDDRESHNEKSRNAKASLSGEKLSLLPTHHPSIRVTPASDIPNRSSVARVWETCSSQQVDAGQHEAVSEARGSSKHSGEGYKNVMSAYFLMLALTLHAVFEGICVGTASEAHEAWTTTLILCAHKWVEGLVLSTNCVVHNVAFKAALPALFFFVIGTPVGALFGMLITFTSSAALEGLFNAAAAGTILYVSCCEIIAEEFDSKRILRKTGVFLLGVLFVAAVDHLDSVLG